MLNTSSGRWITQTLRYMVEEDGVRDRSRAASEREPQLIKGTKRRRRRMRLPEGTSRALMAGDVVAIEALAWGQQWAQATYPKSWRSALVHGRVIGKDADGLWDCDFGDEPVKFERRALSFVVRPGETISERRNSDARSEDACLDEADDDDDDGEDKEEEEEEEGVIEEYSDPEAGAAPADPAPLGMKRGRPPADPSAEPQFLCDEPGCGASYMSCSGWYQHRRKHHPWLMAETMPVAVAHGKRPRNRPRESERNMDELTHACPVCGKASSSNGRLHRHECTHHPELFDDEADAIEEEENKMCPALALSPMGTLRASCTAQSEATAATAVTPTQPESVPPPPPPPGGWTAAPPPPHKPAPSRALDRPTAAAPAPPRPQYPQHKPKKQPKPQPLTVEEARAAAAAEGLELVTSWSSQSGYKGVRTGIHKGKYTVELRRYGTHPEKRYLGSFVTAEEAALHYARYMSAERAKKPPEGAVAGAPFQHTMGLGCARGPAAQRLPSTLGGTSFEKPSRGLLHALEELTKYKEALSTARGVPPPSLPPSRRGAVTGASEDRPPPLPARTFSSASTASAASAASDATQAGAGRPSRPRRIDQLLEPLIETLRELERRLERERHAPVEGGLSGARGSAEASADLPTEAADLIESVLGATCEWRCLGLDPAVPAARAAVRKRFLALAKRLHPDKCADPRAREAFQRLQQAFSRVEPLGFD